MRNKTRHSKLKYRIVRFYSLKKTERTLRSEVTRQHAVEHCHNPESSSATCRKPVNQYRTEKVGPWFDYFTSL